ncbi:hypothetical protein SteCoe_150 [Stentor coeruleus]|uniref:Uncharacterized protein n=1 Tax=Stentor coeruleus TaxID=5963 RepID=A0A1R2D4J9_9CILI|nr:hypothetical protein SteCoe_150 [Stentor coeruleus]
MDMLKSKEGLAAEVQVLRNKLKTSREQNGILSDQLLLLQKECKNLLNSISAYEETNHKLSSQVARLNEKNIQLKKKLKQAVSACSDIKRQAESYISSIQSRFYEQISRMNTFVNTKRDSEETDASYSFNTLSHQSTFKCDSPAISVSERENDSSIARNDSEEIIFAYTQEIKDKQTEITALSKTLEQKSLDLDSFKSNMQVLRENFDKRIGEKEKIIGGLQQEVKSLHEELSFYKRGGESPGIKPGSMADRDYYSSKGINEDYSIQIETLQNKLSSQSKKFDNYIRTIANLEKQVQLQVIKCSELEGTIKESNESIQRLEIEKKEISSALTHTETRVSELETLKIQQAKVINEQSAKLSNLRIEYSPSTTGFKKTIKNLEDDNKRLLEANNYIQNYADGVKKAKDEEISSIKTQVIDLNKELEEKNSKLAELIEKQSSSETPDFIIKNKDQEIFDLLKNEYKTQDSEEIYKKLKDSLMNFPVLQALTEELEDKNYTRVLAKVKNIVTESKITEIYLEDMAIPGQTLPEKLQSLAELIQKLRLLTGYVDFSSITNNLQFSTSRCPSFTETEPLDPVFLKENLTRIIKDHSNKNLSTIAKISNSVQKVNERLGNFLQKYNGQILDTVKEKFLISQIRDYEITTVNECSEQEDDSFDDENLDLKLEQSAKKIKELNNELNLVKSVLEQKEDVIHDLEIKNDRFRIDKEKKTKENNELHGKVSELTNELRTNKEMYELADKKKTSLITTLENRVASMKREMDVLKNLIASEKEELFDHIIRIEQESKNQILWYKSQIEEMKSKLRQHENTLESIDTILGSDFTGDYVESIKKISSKKRRNSFSFNIFRKSSNKSESGSKNGTPTGSEVLSPSASTSGEYIKVHKALEQEKIHNTLHVQQIEALRENIRHLEFENTRNTESKIYQNLRGLVIEVIKMLPIMNDAVERKIQIITALLWLSSEEKLELENRRNDM